MPRGGAGRNQSSMSLKVQTKNPKPQNRFPCGYPWLLMSFICSLIFANEQAACIGLLNEALASRVAAERRDGRKERGGRRMCNAMRTLVNCDFFIFYFFLS